MLRGANGEWVCGQQFNDPPVRISQFHTRIFELQKQGFIIESSTFKNEFGFKSYKLISEPSASHPTHTQPESYTAKQFLQEFPSKTEQPVKSNQATLI